MFLSNPFPDAFGLDIGDLSLKLVRLVPHRSLRGQLSYTVNEVRSVSLPPGLIVNGEIEQPEAVRKKILLLIGKEKLHRSISSPWVVANLPEPKTFLKLISIDTPADDLLYDDVAYHAKRHVPFEIEDTYLDWQVINTQSNPHNPTTQLLIGAVPKVVADSYTYLLEAAGLNPICLEIESVAIARTLITAQKNYTGEARAILDLGATRSSLLVYDHDSVQFSTSLSFSGEIVTTAIAQALKIDYETAEKLKISQGLTYDKDNAKYLASVSQMVDSLVNEIQTAISFYKAHFVDANPVTHITLAGGACMLRNLDTTLSEKLKITASPGNVWKNILSREPTEAEKTDGITYAAALGLAMRAAVNPLREPT